VVLCYFDPPLGVLLSDLVVDEVPVDGGALRLRGHLLHDGVHALGPHTGHPVHKVAVLLPLRFLHISQEHEYVKIKEIKKEQERTAPLADNSATHLTPLLPQLNP
jgi:hypothetical protein